MAVENLILITSIIDTPNIRLSYTNTRSVFNKDERFEQTKKTITGCKQYFKNFHLFLVECSNMNDEELNYFKNECDIFLNLYDNLELRNNIYSISKALGEGTMTIKALEYLLNNNLQYNNFIKISGRYWLNNNFNFNNFINPVDTIIVKESHDINSISTVLYKLPYHIIKDFYTFLTDNYTSMNNCIGYEILFSKFIHNHSKTKIIYLNTLGISGYVSVNKTYFEA